MAAKPKLRQDMDILRADATKVMTDLARLRLALQEVGKDRSRMIVDRLNRQVKENISMLRSGLQRFEKQCRSQAQDVDSHVRANPYLYILSSMGLGFLMGKLGRAKGR